MYGKAEFINIKQRSIMININKHSRGIIAQTRYTLGILF